MDGWTMKTRKIARRGISGVHVIEDFCMHMYGCMIGTWDKHQIHLQSHVPYRSASTHQLKSQVNFALRYSCSACVPASYTSYT